MLRLNGKKITLPNQVTHQMLKYIGSLRDLVWLQLRLSATLRHETFKFMAVEQICESSPAEDFLPQQNSRLPDVISQEQAEELLDQPRSNSPLGIRDEPYLSCCMGVELRVLSLRS